MFVLSSWDADELMLSRREAGMKSRLERCWLMLPMFDHIMYQMPTAGAKKLHILLGALYVKSIHRRRRFTYQDVEFDGEGVEVGGYFEGVFGNLVLVLACAHLAESAVEVEVEEASVCLACMSLLDAHIRI